jgi:hypothetical protein
LRPASLHQTALAALLAAALALPGAEARADGPRTPFVVARGHSLFGAPWRVKFGEERGHGGEPDYATFLFSVGDSAERKEHESGFYESIPLPLPRAFTFDGIFGGEFDSFDERDVAGTAGPRVARIAVTAADGSVFETRPLRAPSRLLGRFPSLRRFRFFDLFFPAAAEPISISAYDRAGKLLESRPGPSAAAPKAADSPQRFVRDPDGYRIELIERAGGGY